MLLSLYLLLSVNLLFSQSLNDVGRIVLNGCVIDIQNKIPQEAKEVLLSKLTQIASENGIGGNGIDTRFILAVKINVTTKDVVVGPPQAIALNIEFVFFIGDVKENKIFSSISIKSKGVGNNETKALISAIQTIHYENSKFSDFLSLGKDRIVAYYLSQCDFIITKANTLAIQGQYDAAIYDLLTVPEVCKSCFEKCLPIINNIYQQKIDKEGMQKLREATLKWNANQNINNANTAAELLAEINPLAASYKEALLLSQQIKTKIETIEKVDFEFKMKKYNDSIALDAQRIDAAKQIAIAYYKNQPQSIIYNHIIW